MLELSMSEAFEHAIRLEMRRDPRVFCMGTALSASLEAEFGEARMRRTPIAENSLSGIAVGAGLSGCRPVIMLNNVTFSFAGFDQLANQAAKSSYLFGEQGRVRAVFRAGFRNGMRRAAQHCQTGYALYAHIGGLKIITPATPADAASLMRTAIQSDDPVICIESDHMAGMRGPVSEDVEPSPFGIARHRRRGGDVTIVGILRTVEVAMRAAEVLSSCDGLEADVIDVRTLVPLDIDQIRDSVARTGRLVVVDESFPTCSMAAEIIATITEDARSFKTLKGVARVCTAPVPVPFSPSLEDLVLPDLGDVVGAVRRLVERDVEERWHVKS